jgi:uncharacterized protein
LTTPSADSAGAHRQPCDLDLLIDAAEGFSLFAMATIAMAIEDLTQTKVDVRTPEDLSTKFRCQIVAEAKPI